MRGVLLTLVLVLGLFSPALAHKISAFVDVEDNTVHLVSYFSDGTPVKNGKVEVLDSSGKVVLTGRTDKNGEFDFKVKKPGTYTAVVIAELGHRAKASFTVGKEELQPPAPSSPSGSSAVSKVSEPVASKGCAVSEQELRKIIREELDPIHRELLKIEEQNAKVSFKDVVGGLGWIMGIFGAAALALSYRRRDGSGSGRS